MLWYKSWPHSLHGIDRCFEVYLGMIVGSFGANCQFRYFWYCKQKSCQAGNYTCKLLKCSLHERPRCSRARIEFIMMNPHDWCTLAWTAQVSGTLLEGWNTILLKYNPSLWWWWWQHPFFFFSPGTLPFESRWSNESCMFRKQQILTNSVHVYNFIWYISFLCSCKPIYYQRMQTIKGQLTRSQHGAPW